MTALIPDATAAVSEDSYLSATALSRLAGRSDDDLLSLGAQTLRSVARSAFRMEYADLGQRLNRLAKRAS